MEAASERLEAPLPGRGRRLLLVGDYPPPWGGIAVHVRALLTLARAHGWDAGVLDVGAGRRSDGRPPEVRSAGGAAAFPARLARAAAGDALVHAHVSGNNAKAWLVALAAGRARRPGAPGAVLTVHSGLAPGFVAAAASNRALVRAACAGFARILCANEGIARALALAGVASARLEVLPAYVAGGIEPGAVPAAARLARERHAPLLAAALAPGRQYGEDVLLDGLRLLARRRPGTGLVAFGPGTGEAAFGERAAGRGLFGRITALGELDHPVALGVIRLADVFVRPTRADGDAISVREALGAGVRVVASDVGHRPPGAILFRAGDPADLADRVETALAAGRPGAGAAGLDAGPRIVRLWQAVSGDDVQEREGIQR